MPPLSRQRRQQMERERRLERQDQRARQRAAQAARQAQETRLQAFRAGEGGLPAHPALRLRSPTPDAPTIRGLSPRTSHELGKPASTIRVSPETRQFIAESGRTVEESFRPMPREFELLIDNIGKPLFPVIETLMQEQTEAVKILAEQVGLNAALRHLLAEWDFDDDDDEKDSLMAYVQMKLDDNASAGAMPYPTGTWQNQLRSARPIVSPPTQTGGTFGAPLAGLFAALNQPQAFVQGLILDFVYGIDLTTDSGDWRSWMKDPHAAERTQEVFASITDTTAALAAQGGRSYNDAIKLFREAFGVTEIQLTSGKNANDETAYASTDLIDGKPVIYLFTDPSILLEEDELRGFALHNRQNIVHELGHALVLLSGGSNSAIYQEWEGVRSLISDFDTTEGWDKDTFDFLLQNKSSLEDVRNGSITRFELENERLANLFQAYVYKYQPLLDPSAEPKQRRAAWAMYTFMTGECPPDDVNIDLTGQVRPCGQGMLHWVEQLGSLP